MKKDIGILVVLILFGLIGAVFLKGSKIAQAPVDRQAADGPGVIPPVTNPFIPKEGSITLKLNQTGAIGNVKITPVSVVEDSRCKEGVQCIWAGTVKVMTRVTSGLGTSEQVIEVGKSITTEAEEITLTAVGPEDNYFFTYAVKDRTLGRCFVGGCSSEVCSDQEGVASNCIYKPEFACYKSAKCERQSDGKCGWTQTPTLTMCLQDAE